MGQAYDEYNFPETDEDGNPLLVATQASAGSTAVGAGAQATGASSAAFGAGAQALGDNSVAVGNRTLAPGFWSVAMGYNAQAKGETATAVGSYAWAQQENAVAVGYSAWALAENALALGAGAMADAAGGTAIGLESWANGTNAIAMGRGALSVANNSIALGTTTLADSPNAIAMGRSALTLAENGIGFGTRATVREDGVNGVAIGADTRVEAADSVALGSGSLADRENTISVGAAQEWVDDLGVTHAAVDRQITNVAAGTEDTDAVNKAQLDEVAGSVGELADSAVQYDDETKGTVTLGGEDGTVVTNVAAGELSADSTDAVNGSQLFETNERVGVVEGRVDDLDTRVGDVEGGVANAVQYDDETKGTATLAGEDGTVVSNLAAGAVSATSTDAINGSQLYDALDSTAAILGGGAGVTAFGTISAPSYMIQGSNYFSVGDALGALDASISQIDQRLTVVEAGGGDNNSNPVVTTDDRVKVDGGDAASVGDGTKGVAV